LGALVAVNEYSMLCTRDLGAPADARQWLRTYFGSDLDAPVLYDAQLVVSELVTNAVRHAEGEIELCAAILGRVLRIEVTDETPDCDPVVLPEVVDDAGRGLRLVRAVASDWGCRSGPARKIVWAEIDLSRSNG
jgi:anti-sigma regulatory factor (Ser/Thr protein kinase)